MRFGKDISYMKGGAVVLGWKAYFTVYNTKMFNLIK